MRECKVCGKEFRLPVQPGRPPVTCSAECRAERIRAQNRVHQRTCGARKKAAGICRDCPAPVAPGHTRCGACLAKLADENRRVIEAARWLLGDQCQTCGAEHVEGHRASALHIHHTMPERKRFEIGRMFALKRWSEVAEEIETCILLCNSCHRQAHKEMS